MESRELYHLAVELQNAAEDARQQARKLFEQERGPAEYQTGNVVSIANLGNVKTEAVIDESEVIITETGGYRRYRVVWNIRDNGYSFMWLEEKQITFVDQGDEALLLPVRQLHSRGIGIFSQSSTK